MLQNRKLTSKDIFHITELINKNLKEITGYRNINMMIKGAETIAPVAIEKRDEYFDIIVNYYEDGLKGLLIDLISIERKRIDKFMNLWRVLYY